MHRMVVGGFEARGLDGGKEEEIKPDIALAKTRKDPVEGR